MDAVLHARHIIGEFIEFKNAALEVSSELSDEMILKLYIYSCEEDSEDRRNESLCTEIRTLTEAIDAK